MKEEIIICPNCNTVYKKKPLKRGEVAICSVCGKELYRNIKGVEFYLFFFSFSAFVFFIISNLYPIVEIDILGYRGSFTIFDTIVYLFNRDFVFVALFTFFTVLFFPLLLIIFAFIFSFLLIVRKKSKSLLTLIGFLKKVVYLDIFFVAILVSIVKVIEYGDINLNIGFFAYIYVLAYFIYFFKYINFFNYWELLDVC